MSRISNGRHPCLISDFKTRQFSIYSQFINLKTIYYFVYWNHELMLNFIKCLLWPVEMILLFDSFFLYMVNVGITLINFQKSNQPCSYGITTAWWWCNTCYAPIARFNVLLLGREISAPMVMNKCVEFSHFEVTLLAFVKKAFQMNWGELPLFLFILWVCLCNIGKISFFNYLVAFTSKVIWA